MKEFTKEELDFLAEVSELTFEDSFQTWVDHMEAVYA